MNIQLKLAAFPGLSQSEYQYKLYKGNLVKVSLPFNTVFPTRSAESSMSSFFTSFSELVKFIRNNFLMKLQMQKLTAKNKLLLVINTKLSITVIAKANKASYNGLKSKECWKLPSSTIFSMCYLTIYFFVLQKYFTMNFYNTVF